MFALCISIYLFTQRRDCTITLFLMKNTYIANEKKKMKPRSEFQFKPLVSQCLLMFCFVLVFVSLYFFVVVVFFLGGGEGGVPGSFFFRFFAM